MHDDASARYMVQTNLDVSEFMSSPVITISSDANLVDAVPVMVQKKIGNLVIVEREDPLGILTEREILYYLSLNNELPRVPIDRVLLQKFIKLSPSSSLTEAAKLMIRRKGRLLVFQSDNPGRDQLIGIITASDIVRGFLRTGKDPALRGVMTTRVYTLRSDKTILAAIKMMYKKRIGSVIIEKENGSPYGIFTERDLLTRVLNVNASMEDKVGDYCSHPLRMARFGIGAKAAGKLMLENGMKRLPLIYRDKVTGIVTARDLVDAFQREMSK